MLRVELADARPGMELAVPVTHPTNPETVLLRSGFTLDAKTISRLLELRAKSIWIAYPGMDFVGNQLCPKILEAGQRLSGAIGKAFGEILPDGKAEMDYSPFRRAISELMERLMASPKARTLIVDLASSQIPLSRSAGHGCFLSLVLGLKLETYLMLTRSRLGVLSRDVSNLGMGALLRDVGVTQLEPDQRWRWRAASDSVDPAWREHVTLGYDMVRGDLEPSAAAAVLNHHQRFDGSGFPDRLNLQGRAQAISGTDIHIFARLIAVADVFDRLRHPAPVEPGAPEPEPVPIVRVLKQMLRTDMAAWFDPIVLRALVHVVPAFPPGSVVTLSDGQRAVVVSWDPLDPCRPVVAALDRFALDPARFEEPGEQIDLSKSRALHIAEAEGQFVAGDLFEPETPDEFDVHKAQSAMIAIPAEELAG
ncbi:MAG: HD domain-containing phosphohydrolase [Planctomycetota bacterium]|nr:HD domain-containing phosphohydrolase [Planctomycetota bacterium]